MDIGLPSGQTNLEGDALLITIGHRPRVEGLNFQQAGIAYTLKGIVVEDHLRISQEHIYTTGDCTGSYQFTHHAAWQAFAIVRNALLPTDSKGVTGLILWTTFPNQEVTQIGLFEE